MAAAVVSVGSLVAAFSYLGFDNALIKYLPTSPTKHRDANTALTISGVASIVGVAIALTIAAESGSELRLLTSSPLRILAFVALCLMTCWNSLTNIVFIADRIAQYVLLTTLTFSLVRFPFLFVLRHDGYSDVTVTWLIGLVLSVFLSFFILYKVTGYKYRPSFDMLSARRMVRFASANYVSSVASNIPALVLPSIILTVIGPQYAAYFYVVYLIITCIYALPQAVCQSLFAEGSKDRDNMWLHVQKATKAAVTVVVPALVVLMIVGYPLLSLFGSAYATHGFGCLIVLCLSGIPTMGVYIGGTILRITNNVRTLLFGCLLGALVTACVGTAMLIVFRSLVTVAAGMLAGQTVTCLVFTMNVARLYRADHDGRPSSKRVGLHFR